MGTIPTISTFTAGAVLTATQQNNIKAAVDFWAQPPMVYAWNSAGITLANSTSTLVALDSEVYDIVQSGDTASHDNTTNNSRLFIRTSAKYRIYAQVQFATNATGNRVITVRKNSGGSIGGGTLLYTVTQGAVSGTSTSVTIASPPTPLVNTDYIEMFASQSSGGNLLIGSDVTTYLAFELAAS